MRAKTAILILLACGGCAATVWTHPTKSQAELAIDQYDCERESVAMYPPVFVRADEKDLGARNGHMDLNESSRAEAWERCLAAHGWSERAR